VKVLLDTHVFMWWINEDARMSENAHRVLSDGHNELVFSAASGWEMAIKVRVGKLRVDGPLGPYLSTQLAQNSMQVLAVSLRHAVGVSELPTLHRDPFDRLLVAQALAEDLAIVTADPAIAQYPVETLW
jgi:PIN domain nuclease of toxin-antitoxin system